jgi:adenylosuccinate synthase
MINGIDTAIITLLDALHGIDPIKMCIGYELDGRKLESWPIHHEIIEKCKPIYKEFAGWKKLKPEDWSELAKQGYNSLPQAMKIYIQAIKEEIKIDIAMVSIGPNRNDTIVLDNNLF